MALHHDTDMVRAIVGARQVKFLFGPARSQGQDTLAQARCTGFASRRLASGCSWRPSTVSAGRWGLCLRGGSRCDSPGGRRLADACQHALGRLEIGQPSGDRRAFGIEACKPLADLRLLCVDLVQYRRCCGRHGGLQWFQVDRDDQSCWRLTLQYGIFNSRMRRLTSSVADAICGSALQPPHCLAAARPVGTHRICAAVCERAKLTHWRSKPDSNFSSLSGSVPL
jgi:hypothetical protein